MRALVTGGAGFIGSHLCDALIAHGHKVVVLDNLSTGSTSNIRHLQQHPKFAYIIDSVMNRGLLAEAMDQCDVVFHLAAAVGVRLIVDSPVHTIETNVKATELLLEVATQKRKKVLFTSTSEVYGKAAKIPFSEDDDMVLGPSIRSRWSYACSKAIDEFLALAYNSERKLPVVIVRLFNTVGPRQTGHYGMVLPRFVGQALSGKPITVYGTGAQSRCFGWVGDVAEALVQLAELPDAVGRIFNIGSDEEVTINRLAELVKEVTGSDSPIEHLSYDQAYGRGFEDMMRRIPDLGRIRAAIGYRPTKGLLQIIQAVTDSMAAPSGEQRSAAAAASASGVAARFCASEQS